MIGRGRGKLALKPATEEKGVADTEPVTFFSLASTSDAQRSALVTALTV